MTVKHRSFFKDPKTDREWFKSWISRLENLNGRTYKSIRVSTELGTTQVWEICDQPVPEATLVIFPGARTTVLFWDLDNGLKKLAEHYRIFLIETNGLPNLSDGATPDIKTNDYGTWAAQVLEELGIVRTLIAGASFGGLICMKLAIAFPEKVSEAFLFNPGCLQPFSLSVKNLYYNLLPILLPKQKNVVKFLDRAVFCKPHHQLPKAYEKLLIDYELFALKRYTDKTQKPYYMEEELKKVTVPVHLVLGDQDLLFPTQRSIDNAKKHLPFIKSVTVFPQVGHGIETHKTALQVLCPETSNACSVK